MKDFLMVRKKSFLFCCNTWCPAHHGQLDKKLGYVYIQQQCTTATDHWRERSRDDIEVAGGLLASRPRFVGRTVHSSLPFSSQHDQLIGNYWKRLPTWLFRLLTLSLSWSFTRWCNYVITLLRLRSAARQTAHAQCVHTTPKVAAESSSYLC